MTRKKKLIKYLAISGAALSTLILLFLIIRFLTPDYRAVIQDNEDMYFRASKIFICGNTIICFRGSETSGKMIFTTDEENQSLAFLDMNTIKKIHILPGKSPDDENLSAVDRKYLGRYKVEVQGHAGFLYLRAKDKRVYGTIRFPRWGTGAYQRLKYVKISRGRISFVRSANSVEETRRLGANRYFTQRFYGKYSSSGRTISGTFINDRKERYQWEGKK